MLRVQCFCFEINFRNDFSVSVRIWMLRVQCVALKSSSEIVLDVHSERCTQAASDPVAFRRWHPHERRQHVFQPKTAPIMEPATSLRGTTHGPPMDHGVRCVWITSGQCHAGQRHSCAEAWTASDYRDACLWNTFTNDATWTHPRLPADDAPDPQGEA